MDADEKEAAVSSKKLPIPLPDYQRIFQLTYSVLQLAEVRITKACLLFSLAGATVLRKHYGLPATVVAGGAAYYVSASTNTALHFGTLSETDDLRPSEHAFHAWVLCDGFVIDFMAPLFTECARDAGLAAKLPRRMFQKRVEQGAHTLLQLRNEGDFYLVPDLELTESLIDKLADRAANADLLRVCERAYRPPPKRLRSDRLTIVDSKLGPRELRIDAPGLAGVW